MKNKLEWNHLKEIEMLRDRIDQLEEEIKRLKGLRPLTRDEIDEINKNIKEKRNEF